MSLLRYFPFSQPFDFKIGTSPLPAQACVIECDDAYEEEVSLKRSLLQQQPGYYFKSGTNTLQVQWEAVGLLLTQVVNCYPQHFTFSQDGQACFLRNARFNESHHFQWQAQSSLPYAPLDWLGRQFQEDLLLLDENLNLVAGQLCFPSGWDLNEKLGHPFLHIHAPLPHAMDNTMNTALAFMKRLPAGKSFQRNNWGVRVSNQLDLSSRHSAWYRRHLHEVSSTLTAHNAGAHLYIRVEHQTLTRLPSSQHVLFTIHTYQSRLENEVLNPARAQAMLQFLKAVPTDLLEYKLMTPFMPVLLSYLEQKVHS